MRWVWVDTISLPWEGELMTTNAKLSVRFETTTCGRCAGSGTYPSPLWNGVCLGCSGTGHRLTRAGRTARKRYDDIIEKMKVTIGDLKVGDRVWANISENPLQVREAWVEVTSIEESSGSAAIINGERIPLMGVTFARGGGLHAQKDHPIKRWDREIFEEACRAVAHLKGATVEGLTLQTQMGTTLLNADGSPILEKAPQKRTSHADCDHPSTPAARRACRARRAND